jgi:hypothetical protein
MYNLKFISNLWQIHVIKYASMVPPPHEISYTQYMELAEDHSLSASECVIKWDGVPRLFNDMFR